MPQEGKMNIAPAKITFSEADRAVILKRIDECLASGQLTLGNYGRQLEEYLAQYIGVDHAVTVNSGTSALEIPLRILDVAGGEVILPTNTFFATALAVLHAGGRVRFADIDPTTFGLDIDQLEDLVNARTRGIIAVHIGGIISPRMAELQAFCAQRDLFFLEDAAHALGSTLNGQQAGTFGDAASFSFYPTKIVTSGEGGVLVTNSEGIDAEARLYRDQGKASFTANVHGRMGYNWRLSEPHAIIGLSHCQRLAEFVAERQDIAGRYDAALESIEGVQALQVPQECSSNYYKYIALLEDGIDRDALKKNMREEFGVGLSGEVYERPVHLQPYFENEYREGYLPRAERLCRQHICLPVYQGMSQAETQLVTESLATALEMQKAKI